MPAEPRALKLLALDTSTELLSIAVQGAAGQIWQHQGAAGAQSSGTLLPAIAALMRQAELEFAQLDAIVFGCGPGSFTGLRTTCAVAQGLAFGTREGAARHELPAVPVDSLLATAEDARMQHGCERVVAALDARMGEVYVSQLVWRHGQWQRETAIAAIRPAEITVPAGYALAGNAHLVYARELQTVAGAAGARPGLPQAAAMLRLAPALLAQGEAVRAEDIAPLYIRNKVALTTDERERLKRQG